MKDSNNIIHVKKPDELIKMRGDFSESALKLSSYLISLLEKDKYKYEINIRDYLKKFDKKMGDFDYMYSVAQEIARKQFKMVDRKKKEFEIFNFVSRVTYGGGVLTVNFDLDLLQYLIHIKDNYLVYEIRYIMALNSKYAIRLYEVLKNQYEKVHKHKDSTTMWITLDELRELLSIPASYKWQDIKRQILEKSKEEINEETDILIDYQPIKKGRKVAEIIFTIKPKFDRKKEHIRQRADGNPKNNKKDNFKIWRSNLLKKGELIIEFDGQNFEVKDRLLHQDGKLLDRTDAWSLWKKFFDERDRIKIRTLDEYEIEVVENIDTKNEINQKLDELKEKYRYILIKMGGEEKRAVVSDIVVNGGILTLFVMVENKTLKKEFENFEELDRFLAACHKAYSKNRV